MFSLSGSCHGCNYASKPGVKWRPSMVLDDRLSHWAKVSQRLHARRRRTRRERALPMLSANGGDHRTACALPDPAVGRRFGDYEPRASLPATALVTAWTLTVSRVARNWASGADHHAGPGSSGR